MTMIQINISDDLKEAFEKAFPHESIERVVERLLRQEVSTQSKATERDPAEAEAILNRFRQLAAKFPALSQDEIRQLRQEGRH